MNPNNIETEVKLYTPDHTPILQKLHSLGANLLYPRILERNLRYENEDQTLVKQGTVLRLRKDSRARLTYKEGGSITDGIVTRQELELEVGDLDTMHLILEKLGYRVFMTYEKYRTTYEFYGAEVVIDELPYGNFTEIEGDHDTIEDIIRTLGLQTVPRYPQSYAKIFTNIKHHLGLDVDNLTFENFKNVVVPVSAFADIEQS